MASSKKPLVAVLMGSQSDWEIMKNSCDQLDALGIPNEAQVISAHRATDALMEYVAAAPKRGVEVFIAGAGMAAHLPGVISAKTDLPVLGVPLKGGLMDGLDALLAIVQMPGGVPVATFAIGKAGAKNAALTAAAILGNKYPAIKKAYKTFRADQTREVLANRTPGKK
jgi:5-(carboxyamino)imidazole ribonucleotide mutase